MAQDIPVVPSAGWYDLTNVPIDNGDGTTTPYTFTFKWNVRDQSWYFDLRDQSNNVIVSSVRVVLGIYLARRSTNAFFREGVLVAFDTTRKGLEATLDNFGVAVKLRRFTAQEVITGRSARATSGVNAPINHMPWWTES